MDHLCQFHQNRFIYFHNRAYRVHRFGNRQTNGQTDGQTDGQTEERTDMMKTLCLHLPIWRGGETKTYLSISRARQFSFFRVFYALTSSAEEVPVHFLPRDAMHKRGLCRHAVSVRLSVTFVDHVKTNKHIFATFLPSGSHTILVFLYQTGWRYSDENPPNGGVECKWGRQKTRF